MDKKTFARISRWLHIYLSMISFVIVLFFSATGLTLNHADYFQSKSTTTELKGNINAAWVSSKDSSKIDKLAVVEFFRNQYKVKGAVSDFRIEESEISLSFKAPGYEADAFINRANASFQLMITSQGFMGFVNDLHKGRDAGKTWLLLIDIAAILMVLISLTGLILLLFIKKKRVVGIVLAVIGVIIMYWMSLF
jgi:uncharacterized protein